jgi:hypothetical protein
LRQKSTHETRVLFVVGTKTFNKVFRLLPKYLNVLSDDGSSGGRNGEKNDGQSGEKSGGRNGEKNDGRNGEKNDGQSGEKSDGRNGEKNDGRNGEKNDGRNGEKSGGRNGEKNDGRNGEKNDGRNGEKSGGRNGEKNDGRNGEKSGGRNGEKNDGQIGEKSDDRNGEKSDGLSGRGPEAGREGLGIRTHLILILQPLEQLLEFPMQYIYSLKTPPIRFEHERSFESFIALSYVGRSYDDLGRS